MSLELDTPPALPKRDQLLLVGMVWAYLNARIDRAETMDEINELGFCLQTVERLRDELSREVDAS